MAINYKGFNTSRHDYNHPLKYYRTVRKVLAKQQGMSAQDLEKLIFLDDEYFTKHRFGETGLTGSWDKSCFQRLQDDGWIELWREYKPPSQAALYRPTQKTHHLVKRIYRILDGAEDLPMSTKRNPIMKSDDKLSYSEKLLKKAAQVMQRDRYKNRYDDE